MSNRKYAAAVLEGGSATIDDKMNAVVKILSEKLSTVAEEALLNARLYHQNPEPLEKALQTMAGEEFEKMYPDLHKEYEVFALTREDFSEPFGHWRVVVAWRKKLTSRWEDLIGGVDVGGVRGFYRPIEPAFGIPTLDVEGTLTDYPEYIHQNVTLDGIRINLARVSASIRRDIENEMRSLLGVSGALIGTQAEIHSRIGHVLMNYQHIGTIRDFNLRIENEPAFVPMVRAIIETSFYGTEERLHIEVNLN